MLCLFISWLALDSQKKTCKEFDRVISQFWWGKGVEGDGIHWKAWREMTKAKSDGGMGFWDFESFNLALLMKTTWRVIKNPGALWVRMLKGLYFPNDDFVSTKKGGRASWAWSSILDGRDCLKPDLIWRVGDGRSIIIWNDRRIEGVDMKHLREGLDVNKEEKVSVLISDGCWNLEKLDGLISEEVKHKILKIPIFA